MSVGGGLVLGLGWVCVVSRISFGWFEFGEVSFWGGLLLLLCCVAAIVCCLLIFWWFVNSVDFVFLFSFVFICVCVLWFVLGCYVVMFGSGVWFSYCLYCFLGWVLLLCYVF